MASLIGLTSAIEPEVKQFMFAVGIPMVSLTASIERFYPATAMPGIGAGRLCEETPVSMRVVVFVTRTTPQFFFTDGIEW